MPECHWYGKAENAGMMEEIRFHPKIMMGRERFISNMMNQNMDIREIQRVALGIYKETVKVCSKHGWKLFVTGGSALGAVRHQGFIPWDDDMDMALPREQFELFVAHANEELPKYIRVKANKGVIGYRIVDTRYEIQLDDFFADVQLKEGEQGYVFVDIQAFDGVPENALRRFLHSIRVFGWRICFRLCDTEKLHTAKWRSKTANLLISLVKKCSIRLKNPEKYMQRHMKAMMAYSYENSSYIADYYGKYRFRDIYPKAWWEPGKLVKFEDTKVRIPSEYDKYLTRIYGNYMVMPDEKERVVHRME